MITTTYSLVEICKIRSGKRLPKGCDFSEAPTAYKYIRARDIKNGTIDGSDLVYISEEVQSKIKKYIVNTNDIVITIVGASVGDVAYVASEFDGMNLTENAVRLTEFAPYVNSKYLMYILNSLEYWELMQQIAGGAAQPKLGIYKIEAIKVHLPPKEVQDRIVDILCTYDDLIENNQKQIKLLEEAAQRLYKEWFVDLRFPGHENTPITDGIPKGWKRERLVDIVNVQYGYAFDGSLFNANGNGTPIVRIRNIPAGTTDDYTTEDAEPQYVVHNGDILVGMDGEFHINSWSGPDAYLVQRTCSFRPNNPNMQGYLLQAIYEPIKYFENTVVGATVAHLGKKHIDTITVLTGPDKLYVPFQQYFNKRQLLLNQNQRLAEARDRLLPKLMNGEIEV